METPIVTGFKQGRDLFVSELRVHGEEVQNCCRNFALISTQRARLLQLLVSLFLYCGLTLIV